MSEQILNKVKQQFGRSAESYVTSEVHAKGWTLARMVELVEPQADWQMLDVATGGGHTARLFAPHVQHVTVSDLTPEMLVSAEKHLTESGITNTTYQLANALDLPFDDACFDLVTCRIAPHHFPDVFPFLQECKRVLKPGGILAIVDNIVPEGAGGDYINAFEKLRDPSHVRCLSKEAWLQELYGTGFTLLHHEEGRMKMEFDSWATRMNVSDDDRLRLKVLLKQAPPEAHATLTPEFSGDRIHFYLQRILLVARG
jgi:ubiquinone/menaquinone biosynthesis C-methylase UbiE